MQKTASSCYRCKEAGQYGCPASHLLKKPPLFLPKRPLSDEYAVPNNLPRERWDQRFNKHESL